MESTADSRKTPLYDVHIELGARMAPFGGFLMPIQYEGIIAEHQAARSEAVLFDTCHMGEFMISGPDAVSTLDRLCTCDIGSIKPGHCRYGMMCNKNGGVIDDLLVYRMGDEEFMLVVNAGTQANDLEWITSEAEEDIEIINISSETAKVDIQGPASPEIVEKLLDQTISDLKYYSFKANTFEGAQILISRTGYTGEIGFEFYAAPNSAISFWTKAMECGAVPAGLGARDTLRLEMGMPLYGHEMDENRNVAESGFTRAICSTKKFVGSDVVLNSDNKRSTLVGIELAGRRAARQGDIVQSPDGEEIGIVTSGSFSPSLEKAIALAYVGKDHAEVGKDIGVATSRQVLTGRIVELPFYKKATARKNIADMLNK